MSCAQKTAAPSFKRAVPVFPTDDVAAAMDYYVNVLGFTKDFQWPKTPGTHPTYGAVIRDHVVIHMAQTDRTDPRTSAPGVKKISHLNIFVRRIHDLYQDFVEKGANIDGPPVAQAYGMMTINVIDPDGNSICFAEPIVPEDAESE